MDWPDRYVEKPDELLEYEERRGVEPDYPVLVAADNLIRWLIGNYSFTKGENIGLQMKVEDLEQQLRESEDARAEANRQADEWCKRVYELEHPEPVHKEFPFACPKCGLEAKLTIDMTPRNDS